jgi:hypothetical protein
MPATRKLDQSRLELQASATGEQATQRAQESRTRNIQQSRNREEQGRQFDESTSQRELDRWQRQWEEKRANDLRQQQLDEQTRQFDVSAGQRDRQLGQRDEEIGISAADKGLERKGGAAQVQAPPTGGDQSRIGGQPELGTQGGVDPRMQAMQAEMARGNARGSAQMSQPIEQDTQGRGYVKTVGRQKAEAEAQGVARTKAASTAYAAITSRRRLGFEMMKAQAAMDASDTKQARIDVAAAMKRAEGPLEDFTGLLDRLEKSVDILNKPSRGLKQNDWNIVRKLFGKTEPVGNAKAVKEAIDSERVNPRLMSWLSEKQTHMVVQFVGEGTGVLPDSKYIDTLSEGWKVFNDQIQLAKMQYGIDIGGPGGLMTTRTRFRQKRMAQKMAAKAILTGQMMTEGGEPLGQAGGAQAGGAQAGGAQAGGAQGATAQGAGEQGGGAREEPHRALGLTREEQEKKDIQKRAEAASRRPSAGSATFEGVPGLGGDPGVM